MLALTLVGLIVLALLLVVGFAALLHQMGWIMFNVSGIGSAIGNGLYMVLAAIAHTAGEMLNSK